MKTKLIFGGLIYFICVSNSKSQNVSFNMNSVPIGVGVNNLGLGNSVLLSLSNGDDNVGLGNQTLRNNQSGSFNTAIGNNGLFNNLTGSNNTGLGFGADVAVGNLNNATAIGSNAVVTTNNAIQLGDAGVTQVFSGVGTNATLISGGLQITGGSPGAGKVLVSNATGVGTWQTLALSGLGGWSTGGNSGTIDGTNFLGTTDNVPLNFKVNGQKSGRIDHLNGNTFLGYLTGNLIGLGVANTAIGYGAYQFSSNGEWNTAVGFQSLHSTISGYNNTAVGAMALWWNNYGIQNTATGRHALYSNTGNNNSAFGFEALYINTQGNNNTVIGTLGLNMSTSGSNNSSLGYNTNVNTGNLDNATAIGANAIVMNSNNLRLGNTTCTLISGNPAVYTGSDARFKSNIEENDVIGLEFISRLRPVVYNFDTKKQTEHITKNMPDSVRKRYLEDDFGPSTAIRQSGFIAQEVEQAAKEVGYNFHGIHKPNGENDYYSLAYSTFVVPLVKAVQEQQAMIAEQKQENQRLQAQMEELKALVSSFARYTSSQNRNATNNTIAVELSDKNVVVLNQNVPNPFAESTVISYNIPTNFTKAQILFSTSDGKIIRTIDIIENGPGSLNVFANDLTNGFYTYTLVIDGKTIDTKKMIKE